MAHNRFEIPEESLKIDWKKADPITNAKEKNFSLKPIVEFVKSILKLFLLGYIVWRVVGINGCYCLVLSGCNLSGIGNLHELVLSILGCMPMIITIDDFGYQWYDNRKKLMMSRQEIKEELKRLRESRSKTQQKLARRRLMNSIAQQVPKADVVVVNPFYFAVALRYDTTEADALLSWPKELTLAMRFDCWQISTISLSLRIHRWLVGCTFSLVKDNRFHQISTRLSQKCWYLSSPQPTSRSPDVIRSIYSRR